MIKYFDILWLNIISWLQKAEAAITVGLEGSSESSAEGLRAKYSRLGVREEQPSVVTLVWFVPWHSTI